MTGYWRKSWQPNDQLACVLDLWFKLELCFLSHGRFLGGSSWYGIVGVWEWEWNQTKDGVRWIGCGYQNNEWDSCCVPQGRRDARGCRGCDRRCRGWQPTVEGDGYWWGLDLVGVWWRCWETKFDKYSEEVASCDSSGGLFRMRVISQYK